MAHSTPNAMFWRGAVAGSPFILVIVPFALLFGVLGTEAGLPLSQVMAFSFLVVAGSAQFTALQLMTDNAPVVIVIISSLAVNLRMAMYSASLVPHLGRAKLWQKALVAYTCVDQAFAVSVVKFEEDPDLTLPQKLAFFAGVVAPVVPLWFGFTYVGAILGEAIPANYALDFAVPITFIALIAPALRTLPHVIAALVSVIAALLLAWVPWNLGLILSAILAMTAGAEAERRLR